MEASQILTGILIPLCFDVFQYIFICEHGLTVLEVVFIGMFRNQKGISILKQVYLWACNTGLMILMSDGLALFQTLHCQACRVRKMCKMIHITPPAHAQTD